MASLTVFGVRETLVCSTEILPRSPEF